MVRTVLAMAAGAALAVVAAVAACSSTPGAEGEATDAAADSPSAAIGEPCDPALASPCVPSANPCSIVVCDPASKTCVENASASAGCDGGASDDAAGDASTGVGAPCTSASDCDGGEACGFLPLEGCAATGTCVA